MHKERIKEVNLFIQDNVQKVVQDYRNEFHLMPPIGWLNDPNGFVYFRGEYHLFFQYHPYSSKWGPMHWGHAKSKDLVHWEHLPVALAPSESYDLDGCYSGSAIVKDEKLYLIYTGHVENGKDRREVQCIASSEDGIHFVKHKENPIIFEKQLEGTASTKEFRDPKVFKRKDKYFIVCAAQKKNRGQILLFQSKDLFSWEFKSVLLEGNDSQGVMWECPDLFHLDDKDVLLISPIQMKKQGYDYHNTCSTVAFIGSVDWEMGKFLVDNSHEIDHGLDFYAPQTCEGPDHQRILVAWMQMWHRNIPTDDLDHHWAGSMTLPRELRVVDDQLVQTPIKDIYGYIDYDESQLSDIESSTYIFKESSYDQQYLKAIFTLGDSENIQIFYAKDKETSFEISYDSQQQLLTVSRENIGYEINGIEETHLTKCQMPVDLRDSKLQIEMFRDTSTMEIFVNRQQTISMTFYDNKKGGDIQIELGNQSKLIQFSNGKIDKHKK